MPIQNILPMTLLWGTLAFCFKLIMEQERAERHTRGISRVRRCETRRRAMYLVEQGRKSRAERMKAYHC